MDKYINIQNNFWLISNGVLGKECFKRLLHNHWYPSLIVTKKNTVVYKYLLETKYPKVNIHLTDKINEDDSLLSKYYANKPNMILVVDFGQIIKEGPLLDNLCIGLHPSLLPELRGPTPIQTAVFIKDKTGFTIYKLDKYVDNGVILYQGIIEDCYYGSNYIISNVSTKGIDKIIQIFSFYDGTLNGKSQNTVTATYTNKINPKDYCFSFNDDCLLIQKKVRAYDAFGGAYTIYNNKRLKVFKCRAETNNLDDIKDFENRQIGEILYTEPLMVKCSNGYIRLDEVQLEGKRVMYAPAWLRGMRLKEGDIIS